MSYRDTRNFIEMLRALGHPSLISIESFRSPNFSLISELLVWLVKRFDPEADISLQIETEDDRVKLIRNAAQYMALKANIKLNTKRLYQADGYSVKELLKITSLLYEALNVRIEEKDEGEFGDNFNVRDFDITDKVNELKLSRQLSTEITSTGATLFDLLAKEADLKSQRNKSLGRQYEITVIESGIRKAMEDMKSEIAQTKQLIENVASTETSLDSKIERRKVEIDRYEKRLQTLKKVRPAFLEEFNVLEKELEQLFDQYSVRLRCLNMLEKQFEEAERVEYEKQLLLTSPRMEPIPLDQDDQSDVLSNVDSTPPVPHPSSRPERPRAGTGGRSKAEKISTKLYGSMQPPISNSTSSLDLSSETESDEEFFIDKDEGELGESAEDSVALELSAMEKRAASTRKTSSKIQSNSDDDF